MGRDDPESTSERAIATAARLERQLEVAQEITHIGSWEWDVATGAVAWSDELYRIYGLAPRSVEISVDSFLDRVHPDDRERVRGEIADAVQRGGRFAHRERILRPDGAVRELDTVGEVMPDPIGRRQVVIGTCRDITEERRREETLRLYNDVVDNMQLSVTVWRADAPGDPTSLRLIACNDASRTAFGAPGLTREMARGKTLAQLAPALMDTELPARMAALGPDAPVAEVASLHLGEATYAARAFVLPDRAVGLALHDVSARERAERVQTGEREALEMLAAGAPLADILEAIVRMIEELAPGTIGSVLLVDDDGQRVRHGAGAHLPAEFRAAIDGAAIGPRAGSCGTAVYRREPVYVADIATDPLWEDYRALALPHGLRACWSQPILATAGHPLGTFAVYRREPRAIDDATRELLGRAAHVAGIAIERRRLDEQLRALTGRIEAVREEERTGIAREIHDQLGQALTALKMDIAWLGRRAPVGDPTRTKLDEMAHAADEVIQSVRRISAELRPGILDDLGLRAAIEWQSEEFERRTGIRCEVHDEIGDLQLERGLATAAFRIFQEALTNVARHADAHRVTVELALERGRLRLAVVDDGVGLSEHALRTSSLGLLGMRERARRQGGDLEARRGASGGTVIEARLPLRFPQERRTDADSEMGR